MNAAMRALDDVLATYFAIPAEQGKPIGFFRSQDGTVHPIMGVGGNTHVDERPEPETFDSRDVRSDLDTVSRATGISKEDMLAVVGAGKAPLYTRTRDGNTSHVVSATDIINSDTDVGKQARDAIAAREKFTAQIQARGRAQDVAATPSRAQIKPQHRAALKRYQAESGSWQTINSSLRSGKPLSPQDAADVAKLDDLTLGNKLDRDVELYRGMPAKGSPFSKGKAGDLVGKTYSDKGFTSASRKYEDALNFTSKAFGGGGEGTGGSGVVLHLTVPRGSAGAYLGTGEENETLLPRGTSLHVTRVESRMEDTGRVRLIHAQVLPRGKTR